MMLLNRKVRGGTGFLFLFLLYSFVLLFEEEDRIKGSILHLYKLRYLKDNQEGIVKWPVNQIILDLIREVWDGYIKLKVVGIWLVL